jgi:hypothetical protein
MAKPRVRFSLTEITVSCNAVFNVSISVRADKAGDMNLCLQFQGGIPCEFLDPIGAPQSTICKRVRIVAVNTPQTVVFPFTVSCSRPGFFDGLLDAIATDSGGEMGSSSIQIHVRC